MREKLRVLCGIGMVKELVAASLKPATRSASLGALANLKLELESCNDDDDSITCLKIRYKYCK